MKSKFHFESDVSFVKARNFSILSQSQELLWDHMYFAASTTVIDDGKTEKRWKEDRLHTGSQHCNKKMNRRPSSIGRTNLTMVAMERHRHHDEGFSVELQCAVKKTKEVFDLYFDMVDRNKRLKQDLKMTRRYLGYPLCPEHLPRQDLLQTTSPNGDVKRKCEANYGISRALLVKMKVFFKHEGKIFD